jgi:hypothetical protein
LTYSFGFDNDDLGVEDGEEATFFVSGLWEENGLPFDPTEGRGTFNLPLL